MSYGMKLVNQDGTLAYDSTSPGGVFVQFITLPVGTNTSTQTINLPSQYRAMTLLAFPIVTGDHQYFILQGNPATGVLPRLNWFNNTSTSDTVNRRQTIIMVLAT